MLKNGKDPLDSLSWRPIHLLSAISKIVEKTLQTQIVEYVDQNQIFHHAQHGSVKHKSTITALAEIQENIKNAKEDKIDSVLLAIDQSLAYAIVSHEILIEKLKVCGFAHPTVELLRDYLRDRKHRVQVNAQSSQPISVGPISVSQGSILSCIFFLVYTMDLPEIFHTQVHTPQNYSKCPTPNATILWMMQQSL